MEKLTKHSLRAGQILLGLYFILPGLAKFADWQRHIELMERHNVPFTDPLLFMAAIANLGLGGLLVANRHTAYAAYGCAAYIVVINFSLHDFWNFTGIEGAHETQNFVKNTAILAGCLILAGAASRPQRG
jgi:putative oxidoreductase